MTQGVYKFPQFEPTPDNLPPENIEAEEAVLGALLLDEQAIYRVKDRLKIEHFYIDAHKDIYQACLRLHKKNQPINLLTVTSWLTDHKLLRRIGGRNKLAQIVDRTVSSVNIDAHAALVIEKSLRRDLLRLGNDFIHLGYNGEIDFEEILDIVYKKTRSIVETPSVQTKEEYELANYNRLVEQLKVINTTIPDPGFRLWKLQSLANECQPSMTVKFLDHLYTKTLTSQCSSLMTYEELKIAAGKTIREWLLQGLVPKKTTIVLYSDGGLGKTKFVYGIGKALIQGKAWGDFHSTGSKRKILYYQGDETEADMYHALSAMGYDDADINQYVKTRMNWSFENIPQLIQDLNDFKPDFVVIDSLTHANRMSVYRESEVEYCRPLLEITGLANQHNCTFLVIHHANKEGKIRGSTAIRNSVSEVWCITKDNSPEATPDDRFLEIDKSRSRSSGKKYRMIFSGDDLSFTYLGEETTQTETSADRSAKDKLLKFFDRHRNIKYSIEELVHEVGFTSGHLRTCLLSLSIDGLISVDRKIGRKYNLYYLEGDVTDCKLADRRSDDDQVVKNAESLTEQALDKNYLTDSNCKLADRHLIVDQVDDPETKTTQSLVTTALEADLDEGIKIDAIRCDQEDDQERNNVIAGDSEVADRLSTKKNLKKLPFSKNEQQFSRSDDQQTSEALLNKENSPDRVPDRQVIEPDRRSGNDDQQTLEPLKNREMLPDRQVIGDQQSEQSTLPLIKEKGKYWSKSLQREVQVFSIFDVHSQASCRVPGKGTLSLSFTDLLPVPESPKHDLAVGNEVVILVGKDAETFATITDIREDGIFLKGYKGKLLGRAYYPHQLVKTS